MSDTIRPEASTRPPAASWTPTGRAHLVDTHSFVFWVCAAATAYGAIHVFDQVTSSPTVQVLPAIAWAALVQWSLFAAVFLWLLLAHQAFVRRAPTIVFGALLWGAFAATYFASQANAAFEDLVFHWFGTDTDSAWNVAFSAATNEEILKLTGVLALFLLPRARLRGPIDGLFYGALVGLGFQICEDFLYTIQQSGDLSQVLGFLFTRGFVTGVFSHAAYTAVTGFGLGWCIERTDRSWAARLGVAIGSFLAVWSLHLLWDAPLVQDAFGDGAGGAMLVILVKGLPLLAILLFALRWARTTERARWNEFVGTYVDPTLLPAADVQTLQTRASRREARRLARQAGGRRAAKATEMLQTAQLRHVQAVEEQGADSAEAAQWAGRIVELHAALSASRA